MPFSDATIISGHHCPLICVLSPYVYTFIAVTTIYNSFTCCLYIHLLVFEYELRAYNGINGRQAMLDLISNI